ncbi:MAG TPA: hypothetical protein VN816_09150 [Acidimicrobiales bacterium]|nr:hypothetical protein [Acidimicrobiales bacterium]
MDSSPETATAPAPNAVFSPDDDLAALWFKAYQGEVSGEVLFGGVADRTDDPDHRKKLDVLRLLEARTREACVPAMDRNGFPTDPDPQTVSDAEALAEAAATLSWADFLGAFEGITTQFLALYRRIGEVAEADKAESELLVAHEEALREFARRELAGHTDDSLELIEALPHMG